MKKNLMFVIVVALCMPLAVAVLLIAGVLAINPGIDDFESDIF